MLYQTHCQITRSQIIAANLNIGDIRGITALQHLHLHFMLLYHERTLAHSALPWAFTAFPVFGGRDYKG